MTTILCVGLATVDLVYRVDRIPGVDEKAQATSMEIAAGGPAANAAVAAAALGASVTLVTAIGAHPLGELIRADLTAFGVRVLDAAPNSAAPPPVSAVTVLDGTGERTIVSRNAGDFTARVPEDGLPDADLTLVDGHHPALCVAAARAAGRLLVDAGSWRPVFADVLPHADVVACSATFRHPAARSAGDAATAAAVGAPHVVVTHGRDPVRWFSGGSSGEVAVPPVAAVDTAGAGDVFHGALAVALAGQALARNPPAPLASDDPATAAPAREQRAGDGRAREPRAREALAREQRAGEAGAREALAREQRARAAGVGEPRAREALVREALDPPAEGGLVEAIAFAVRVAGVRVAHPGPRSWLEAIWTQAD